MKLPFVFRSLLLLPLTAAGLSAQPATIVYRLGHDTLAVEQYARSGNRLAGEMVQRNGPSVLRMQYDLTTGPDGRLVSGTLKRMQGDGSPIANQPSEARFRVTADSLIRELVFPDSVQRRAIAAKNAVINFPTFVYGPTELLAMMRRTVKSVDSLPAFAFAGGPTYSGLTVLGGDSVRLHAGGAYAMVLRFDANGRLQSVDGSNTTNKVIGTRTNGTADIATLARGMKPSGVLSGRDVTRATFGPGGIVSIDYGRPLVRERTVWGGVLVPFDSVWRAGANDATHLFTTRTLTFGSLTVPPGMYTLWVQHTRNGTFLIINKQTGIWGTQYDSAQDLGRVPMTMTAATNHVEEFTTTLRAMGNRGTIEMAWGPSVVTAQFTAR